MRFRKLRIAWSVVWVATTLVLLLAMVRTIWRQDVLSHSTQNESGCYFKEVHLISGMIVLQFGNYDDSLSAGWHYKSGEAVRVEHKFGWSNAGNTFIRIPIWMALLFTIPNAIIAWPYWRFSLRTLLIATTLAAVALGLTAYAIRNN